MTSAVTALDAGDYATAERHAIAAQGLQSAVPHTKFAETELEWTWEKIEKFIQNIRRLGRRSTGIRRTRITYAEVSDG